MANEKENKMDSDTPVPVPDEYQQKERVQEHRSLGERILTQLYRDKLAMVGAVVIVGFVLLALFADFIAPYDPDATFDQMVGPNGYSQEGASVDGEAEQVWHPLGTDSFGHDLLSRMIFGARISLLVALATVAFAFTAGTAIGAIAGYYGGVIDTVLMRFVDFMWAFPAIILAAGLIAFLGGLGVTNVIIAIGVAFIDDFARLVRGEVLSLREKDFVLAARTVGLTDVRIMTREVLPNAVAPIIVQVTLMIPLAILAEAALSFLGLGVRPTTPTWGLLLGEGRQFISQAWWISIFPGLAIMIAVLAFNLFGDSLRDAFDVKQQEVSNR